MNDGFTGINNRKNSMIWLDVIDENVRKDAPTGMITVFQAQPSGQWITRWFRLVYRMLAFLFMNSMNFNDSSLLLQKGCL